MKEEKEEREETEQREEKEEREEREEKEEREEREEREGKEEREEGEETWEPNFIQKLTLDRPPPGGKILVYNTVRFATLQDAGVTRVFIRSCRLAGFSKMLCKLQI